MNARFDQWAEANIIGLMGARRNFREEANLPRCKQFCKFFGILMDFKCGVCSKLLYRKSAYDFMHPGWNSTLPHRFVGTHDWSVVFLFMLLVCLVLKRSISWMMQWPNDSGGCWRNASTQMLCLWCPTATVRKTFIGVKSRYMYCFRRYCCAIIRLV